MLGLIKQTDFLSRLLRNNTYIVLKLLEVLATEDVKVLEDVQQLQKLAPFIAEVKSEVFEIRRNLRTGVIQERLDEYRKVNAFLFEKSVVLFS